jgi:RNA polymerase sigma-70 factor, ECF subfamily
LREPEPETLEAARRGDAGAFEELVRMFLPDVYRLAWHLVRDRQTAEDVAQETFLGAYRAIGRFRLGEKFSTWLFRIARNRSIDALRRRGRDQRLTRTLVPPSDVADPSLRAALHAAIDGLDRDVRDTFIVVEVLGFSYPEAGKILGVAHGTVKSRMHRARKHLIVALADQEDVGEV